MKPVDFEMSNCVIGNEIPANRSNGIVLSRWKVETLREWLSLLFNGAVWLAVRGDSMRPTLISGDDSFTIVNLPNE